jgi:probable F420-dependent oxidoreductase
VSRLRISVTISGLSRLFGPDLAALLDFARLADEAGIDGLALPDHLAIGPRTDRYPYGRFPLPEGEPWLEPLTALAAIAGVTHRMRLATNVLIAPLRPPLLLAKQAATLDVLSRGRLDLGVGLGWQREEFEAAGVPFEGRAARLDDALRACRALWREAPASFRSPTVSFEQLRCLPRPVQPGGPPLWLGLAATPANAARLAELADGWLPMAADPALLGAGVARLRDALRAAGRDPEALAVRANVPLARDAAGHPDLERSLAALPQLAAAGATGAAFALGRFVRAPADLAPFVRRLGRLAHEGR